MNVDTSAPVGQKKKRRPWLSWLSWLVGLSITAGAGGVAFYYAINLSPVGCRHNQLAALPITPETLAGYLEDPSSCAANFLSNYTKVDLIPKGGSVFDIKLTNSGLEPVVVPGVDLRTFLPRVSPIAQGDKFLTLLTLQQREINRNDTIFPWVLAGGDEVNISNNCLREGLWEAYLTRKSGPNAGKYYHGWFEFPVPLYKQLFKTVNGFDLDGIEPVLEHYLRLDGEHVNLEHLRHVISERCIAIDRIDRHLDELIGHFGEQQHKAKLIATAGLERYSDIYAPDRQPVRLMQFAEPGRYAANHLMAFDYTFLGKPKEVAFRKAKNDRLNDSFNELEISFAVPEKEIRVKNWPFLRKRNGLKLILGGWHLNDIPMASEQPIPISDFKRFTFGIGTPEVYATYSYRLQELAHPSNAYLLLVDEDGRHVDNHTLGLDQVYISRLPDDTMVLYLVSYERIMLVAHWNFKLPADAV